jgi:hypothetical protein
MKLAINVPFVFIWRKTLYGGQMYFKGHWKGWALTIATFLCPEIATSEASASIWHKQVRTPFFPGEDDIMLG